MYISSRFQHLLLTVLLFSIIVKVKAQNKPIVVIGIVIDQLSTDHINRYWNDFGDEGFKKLIADGCYFPNTFYNYSPTATGPGHATIYTGSNPSGHGIVGNRWFELKTGQIKYCVADDKVLSLGVDGKAGQRSPANLKGATMGDMLKLSTSGRSKVFSLAIKDRSAILPGGHRADLALWWDNESGKWISSDYYTQKLPDWLRIFEQEHNPYDYLRLWDKQEDASVYADCTDHDEFEESFKGKQGSSMPHDLMKLSKEEGLGILKYSPFGNTYTFDVAMEMMKSTEMGKDLIPDLFTISFSSTDYIGHRFGPHSEEVKDAYLRFDKELGRFLSFLESEWGRGYVLFLTSDHGVMPNTEFLNSRKIPSRRFDFKKLEKHIQSLLQAEYGSNDFFLSLVENKIYLNEQAINSTNKSVKNVEIFLADKLMRDSSISLALSANDLVRNNYTKFPHSMIQDGFNKERSGNVLFVLEAFSSDANYKNGASHGSPYVYDRQVPLIFTGMGIAKGKKYYQNVSITQIVPSLSDLLQIQRPPTCTDGSLTNLLKP